MMNGRPADKHFMTYFSEDGSKKNIDSSSKDKSVPADC